jgi:hypothetical protein
VKACEGRREDEGEKAETEGDLKQSSGDLVALAGVIGEAIGLESLRIGVGVSIVTGDETKVDKEDNDSGLDDIEPCWRGVDVEMFLHSPTKLFGFVLVGLNSSANWSSIPDTWKV